MTGTDRSQAIEPAGRRAGIAGRREKTPVYSSLKVEPRAVLRRLWILFLYGSGLLWWAKRRLAARGGVVVLTFHRVLPDGDFEKTNSPRGMVMRERTFARLARHLAQECELVDLAGGEPDWSRNGGRLRVALTFDDGWADNAGSAFPIARESGLPWTIFICPERAGRAFPFWPERVVALWRAAARCGVTAEIIAMFDAAGESGFGGSPLPDRAPSPEMLIERLKLFPADLREAAFERMSEIVASVEGDDLYASAVIDSLMTWDDMEGLASCGVTFGSHTLSHVILTRVLERQAQREIANSKWVIERKLRRPCRLFANPNSDWSYAVREMVAQAGYELAFAGGPGVWERDTDPLLIPRVNLWEGSVTCRSGAFSRIALEYTTFWKAYRAAKAPARRAQEPRFASSGSRRGRSVPMATDHSVRRREEGESLR